MRAFVNTVFPMMAMEEAAHLVVVDFGDLSLVRIRRLHGRRKTEDGYLVGFDGCGFFLEPNNVNRNWYSAKRQKRTLASASAATCSEWKKFANAGNQENCTCESKNWSARRLFGYMV